MWYYLHFLCRYLCRCRCRWHGRLASDDVKWLCSLAPCTLNELRIFRAATGHMLSHLVSFNPSISSSPPLSSGIARCSFCRVNAGSRCVRTCACVCLSMLVSYDEAVKYVCMDRNSERTHNGGLFLCSLRSIFYTGFIHVQRMQSHAPTAATISIDVCRCRDGCSLARRACSMFIRL